MLGNPVFLVYQDSEMFSRCDACRVSRPWPGVSILRLTGEAPVGRENSPSSIFLLCTLFLSAVVSLCGPGIASPPLAPSPSPSAPLVPRALHHHCYVVSKIIIITFFTTIIISSNDKHHHDDQQLLHHHHYLAASFSSPSSGPTSSSTPSSL